ncbi:MAG: hypothetical protein WD492_10200 [Alkalispirochaeta sp.]
MRKESSTAEPTETRWSPPYSPVCSASRAGSSVRSVPLPTAGPAALGTDPAGAGPAGAGPAEVPVSPPAAAVLSAGPSALGPGLGHRSLLQPIQMLSD